MRADIVRGSTVAGPGHRAARERGDRAGFHPYRKSPAQVPAGQEP
jgi:hypothetical protein